MRAEVAGIDLWSRRAGPRGHREHVLPALARGTPCVVASVGALSARPG
jgi:aspartate dehydrogenase